MAFCRLMFAPRFCFSPNSLTTEPKALQPVMESTKREAENLEKLKSCSWFSQRPQSTMAMPGIWRLFSYFCCLILKEATSSGILRLWDLRCSWSLYIVYIALPPSFWKPHDVPFLFISQRPPPPSRGSPSGRWKTKRQKSAVQRIIVSPQSASVRPEIPGIKRWGGGFFRSEGNDTPWFRRKEISMKYLSQSHKWKTHIPNENVRDLWMLLLSANTAKEHPKANSWIWRNETASHPLSSQTHTVPLLKPSSRRTPKVDRSLLPMAHQTCTRSVSLSKSKKRLRISSKAQAM